MLISDLFFPSLAPLSLFLSLFLLFFDRHANPSNNRHKTTRTHRTIATKETMGRHRRTNSKPSKKKSSSKKKSGEYPTTLKKNHCPKPTDAAPLAAPHLTSSFVFYKPTPDAGRWIKIKVTGPFLNPVNLWGKSDQTVSEILNQDGGYFEQLADAGTLKERHCNFKIVHPKSKKRVDLRWTPAEMFVRCGLDRIGQLKDEHQFTLNQFHTVVYGHGG